MSENQIQIGAIEIGDGCPFFTIAEIGSNFDGNLDRAKMLVKIAKDSGADAVKFQSFLARKLVSSTGFSNLKIGYQSAWDQPVEEVYEGAEFPREWHKEIAEYCREIGIIFFSAPYDLDAIELLESLDVPIYKIGSGDLGHRELVSQIAQTGKPVIVATGAATIDEVDFAIDVIKSAGNNQIVLLQCVTNYPASFKDINASVITMFRERYGTLTGYSDHTPGYMVALATIACGGCMIEKHFTDDKARKGPDHPFAMDARDFRQMVDQVRFFENLIGNPEKKVYEEEKETAVIMKRGIRARVDILKGTRLSYENLEVLRPREKGTICASRLEAIIGRRVTSNILKGIQIREEDLG